MKTKIVLFTLALITTFNSFSQSSNFIKRKYMKGIFHKKNNYLKKNQKSDSQLGQFIVNPLPFLVKKDSVFLQKETDKKMVTNLLEVAKSDSLTFSKESTSALIGFSKKHNTIYVDSSKLYSSTINKIKNASIKHDTIIKKLTPLREALDKNYYLEIGDSHAGIDDICYQNKHGKTIGKTQFQLQLTLRKITNGLVNVLKVIGCAILLALLYAIAFIISHPEEFAIILPSIAYAIEIVAAIVGIICFIIFIVWLFSFFSELAGGSR